VRAVVEAAGIKDILSKSLGSSNPVNVVQAALLALTNLRDPQDVVHLRRRVAAPPAAANGAVARTAPVAEPAAAVVAEPAAAGVAPVAAVPVPAAQEDSLAGTAESAAEAAPLAPSPAEEQANG
jgi:hypothetical protein